MAYGVGNYLPEKVHVPYWAKKPSTALVRVVPLHVWHSEAIATQEQINLELSAALTGHDVHPLWVL